MKKPVAGLLIILLLAAGIVLLAMSRRRTAVSVSTPPKLTATYEATNPVTNPKVSHTPILTVPTNSAVIATPIQVANLSSNAGVIAQSDSVSPVSLPQNTVCATVRSAVRQYNQMLGGNPVGTNPEITSALTGGNPKHINFINAEGGMRVNSKGEMIDNWGTPYFFHQVSGNEMEIHSAGPDKIMWTSDDIVAR